MTIRFLFIGKTFQPFIQEGCNEFEKRLSRYARCEIVLIPDVRNQGTVSPAVLKKQEAEAVLKKLKPEDHVVLLDEKGRQYTSVELSAMLQEKMNRGTRSLVLLVGGAFGFDDLLYDRANEKWSLSKLTFSHQMVRLFLIEQVYRAFTILKNEPYHNE